MTSTFLATLGTAPYLGRTFTTAEHDTASDSVVISYEAWQRRFGRDVDTMRTMMARTVANKRYRATLSSMFGGAALVLAAIGLFGLLTRAVNERRREIGVRMAVGARPGDVVRLVMREGGLLVAGGLVVGMPAALAVAQLIRAQLYGGGPSDPHVFVFVSVVLSVVAAGAMAVPAIRASRVDPISTLRAE